MLTDKICIGCSGISIGLNKVWNVHIKLKGFKLAVVTEVTKVVSRKGGEVRGICDFTPAFKIISDGLE